MRRNKFLFLNRKSSVSLQMQLVRQLKGMIQSGQLTAGDSLPSTRELAAELRISRNTVVYAYERLLGEGYLESRMRSRVYVSDTAPELRIAAERSGREASPRTRISLPGPQATREPLPFRPCQPDVSLFPLELWNRLRGRALRSLGTSLLHYNSEAVLGFRPLRENLAAYLRESRGVVCDWWQVAITSGSQQALYLLAHLLLKPGDVVGMEDPGYAGAIRAWKSASASIHYCPIDQQGVVTAGLDEVPLKLMYVTPSRQFPSGASLSLLRRLALVRLAAEKQAWIVEDDYDSEFRYCASPLPSLQSLESGHRTLYLGTFSKLLCPSLRLGYAVLPESLIEPFSELKATVEDHGPMIDQATLASFLDTGALYSHIRRCRKSYSERQQAFLHAAQGHDLPFEFRYRDGGMNLTGYLPAGSDDKALSLRLRQCSMDVPALSSYSQQSAERGLVFGFTAFSPETIAAELAKVGRMRLDRELKPPAAP